MERVASRSVAFRLVLASDTTKPSERSLGAGMCSSARSFVVMKRMYPSYKSIAKCAGKDYRDGAVVPFE